MSTYEQDREDSAVGPELCDECFHALRLHGSDGCQFERGDRWVDGESMGAWRAGGPCGCQATTLEPINELDYLQQRLAAAYSVYLHTATRNLIGHLYQSSPLAAKHKLDVSFDELEAT